MRTKLDELKRQEVGRLRMLIKAKLDSLQGRFWTDGEGASSTYLLRLGLHKVPIACFSLPVWYVCIHVCA